MVRERKVKKWNNEVIPKENKFQIHSTQSINQSIKLNAFEREVSEKALPVMQFIETLHKGFGLFTRKSNGTYVWMNEWKWDSFLPFTYI